MLVGPCMLKRTESTAMMGQARELALASFAPRATRCDSLAVERAVNNACLWLVEFRIACGEGPDAVRPAG